MKPLGPHDPLRLGPYRVVGVLGTGGMGRVYLGHDAQGRVAAVKMLLPELVGEGDLARRFVREALTARAVTSDGVARVRAADVESGRPWIATEYLAGPTLTEAVRRYGPFGEAPWRQVAHSLARTVGDIHRAGLVHRDLKPGNVILTSHGPRIIDFGIARPEHGLTLTHTGQIPATPGYGAPEQVLGRRTGPAADVFALGAVLAFTAAGRPAYPGGTAAGVLYEVVHGEPDLDAVPAPLRDLIRPCLAKAPADRPLPHQIQTAADPHHGVELPWCAGPLADDIRGHEAAARRLVDDPGAAGPPPVRPPAPPAASAASRRRLLGTLAAGTLLAAGAGGTAWWLTGDRPGRDGAADPPPPPPPPPAPPPPPPPRP
ncbi:serine/threonine-protein kinase [Streptomyces sp. HSW2009]|uniref:serine/threonine-protein kinase n=1 Tax=Streptomyces sp. HSW2009 TaxID=3142890 RepID=UPI0032EEFDF6